MSKTKKKSNNFGGAPMSTDIKILILLIFGVIVFFIFVVLAGYFIFTLKHNKAQNRTAPASTTESTESTSLTMCNSFQSNCDTNNRNMVNNHSNVTCEETGCTLETCCPSCKSNFSRISAVSPTCRQVDHEAIQPHHEAIQPHHVAIQPHHDSLARSLHRSSNIRGTQRHSSRSHRRRH